MTDVHRNPWIDQYVDALNIPYPDHSLDAILCSHMIHHLARPPKFFAEIQRVLRPGGLLVISDIWTSFIMRVLLRIFRHEGWSNAVDVFDENTIANDPADPWSANCSIPHLLFQNKDVFEKKFPSLKIRKFERTEFMIFPLSGGVIAKAKIVPLPYWLLRIVHSVDRLLSRAWPEIFALGVRVVIEFAPDDRSRSSADS